MILHVDKPFRDDETVVADEGVAGCSDSLLTVGCQGDVRGAGVAAVERPLRLAVADNEAARRRHLRPLSGCDSSRIGGERKGVSCTGRGQGGHGGLKRWRLHLEDFVEDGVGSWQSTDERGGRLWI